MTAPVLTRSVLRAFLYTFDLAPIRRTLAAVGPEAAATTLDQLAPHEVARVLAALPAGQQNAVFRALDAETRARLRVTAEVNAHRTSAAALEQIVGRLGLKPAVTAARWRMETVGEQVA